MADRRGPEHIGSSPGFSAPRRVPICLHLSVLPIMAPSSRRSARLAAALALCASAARAAEGVPDLTQYSLEELVNLEVSSASKFTQKASDAPASITVLTAREFRDYGWRTLADALRSVRGFYVTDDRQYSYVGVRGFGRPLDYNTRLLVLIDGIRVNDNVYDTGYIGRELLLDVDLIDRVEIVRGPGSSVYGSNAFFGVVNVVTKSAAQLKGVEVAASAASHDEIAGRITGAHTGANGLALTLSASGLRDDGQSFDIPSIGRTAAETDRSKVGSVFARLSYDGGALEVLHGDRRKAVPGGQQASLFDDPDNRIRDVETLVSLLWERPIGGADVSARLTYGDYQYRASYAYGAPDYPVRTLLHDDGEGQWWTAEIKASATLAQRHRVVAGIEYQDNSRQDQSNFAAGTVYLDDRRTSWRYGLYVQDDYSLLDNLIVSAGLRYDALEGGQDSLNPRLGLIYHPDTATALKLLYGTAFRTPNVYESFWSFPGTEEANLNLKPEKISTLEGVVERVFADTLRVSASVFRYRISDLIQLGVGPGGLNQYQNIAAVRATGAGIEAELGAKDALQLRASYSYSHATDGDGNRLTNSPLNLAKLNVSAPLGRHLRGGVEAQYVSGRTTDLQPIDAYTVVNATLIAIDLAPRLEVSASVYNLFDARYFDPAELDGVHGLMPQPGRAFRLKAVYRF
jgi:iron complex outermembrane receptor protein